MAIRFLCPVCKTTYAVNDRVGGTKFQCKACGQRVQVPAPLRSKTILGEILPADNRDTVSNSSGSPQSALFPERGVEGTRAEDFDEDEPAKAEPRRRTGRPESDNAPFGSPGYVPPLPKSGHLPITLIAGLVGLGVLILFAVLGALAYRAFSTADTKSADGTHGPAPHVKKKKGEWGREELKSEVYGKTLAEVVELIGPPDAGPQAFREGLGFSWKNVTFNPQTHKPDTLLILLFEGGVCVGLQVLG